MAKNGILDSWGKLAKVAATAKRPAPVRAAIDTPGTPEWNARQDAASTARWDRGSLVPTIVTAPNLGVLGAAAAAGAKKYTSTKPGSKGAGEGGGAGGAGGAGGSYADGYNKAVADANANKSDDAPQIAALEQMIATGFGSARDTKLGNLETVLGQQDSIMLEDYLKRAGSLGDARADNDKSEHDSSFANIANRARERGDILNQATAQGAGESDTLRATLQSLRNWSANQADVNRSYFDTMRSVNTAITDLNIDTKTARTNLHTAANSDRESVWTNFYNQQADAYTQIGNIRGNPTSGSYEAGNGAFAKAAEVSGTAWKNPGIPAAVQDWQGSAKAEDRMLNNGAIEAAPTNIGAPKKPEGATLRKW